MIIICLILDRRLNFKLLITKHTKTLNIFATATKKHTKMEQTKLTEVVKKEFIHYPEHPKKKIAATIKRVLEKAKKAADKRK